MSMLHIHVGSLWPMLHFDLSQMALLALLQLTASAASLIQAS